MLAKGLQKLKTFHFYQHYPRILLYHLGILLHVRIELQCIPAFRNPVNALCYLVAKWIQNGCGLTAVTSTIAGCVYVIFGFVSGSTRRLSRQWFWLQTYQKTGPQLKVSSWADRQGEPNAISIT